MLNLGRVVAAEEQSNEDKDGRAADTEYEQVPHHGREGVFVPVGLEHVVNFSSEILHCQLALPLPVLKSFEALRDRLKFAFFVIVSECELLESVERALPLILVDLAVILLVSREVHERRVALDFEVAAQRLGEIRCTVHFRHV